MKVAGMKVARVLRFLKPTVRLTLAEIITILPPSSAGLLDDPPLSVQP
jgi:hypothetical protein